MKKILFSCAIIIGTSVIYTILLIFPKGLFAHEYHHSHFNVYSDQQISGEIQMVLDKSLSLLQRSELYKGDEKFTIYLCNEDWRFRLLTRNPGAGGQVNFVISPNIFIRSADVESNSIIPPDSWRFPLNDRPLSYFIAHEAVHVLQRNESMKSIFNLPIHILEGYADYIAKADASSFETCLQDYLSEDPRFEPVNGLYNLYHLYIAYLIEIENLTYREIAVKKPSLESILLKIEELPRD